MEKELRQPYLYSEEFTSVTSNGRIEEDSHGVDRNLEAEQADLKKTSIRTYKWDIVWPPVIFFVYLQISSLYAIYLIFYHAKGETTIWTFALGIISLQGITSGAHRLWTHRSYKAKWPLRLVLAVLQTACYQRSIYYWVRTHRLHHKFSDTDADPHNASRGFFFSHWGWLMLKRQEEVTTKGKEMDLSDLESDPIVMFQKKYYHFLMFPISFLIPALIPCYFWNESLWISWNVASILRYNLQAHVTFSVNSAAHIWGMKPFDKNIQPAENWFVAILAQGEGWHNFHHCFPWDYKTSELGKYGMNFSTAFIDIMQSIGQAYDLKITTKEVIESRSKRTGDTTNYCRNDAYDYPQDSTNEYLSNHVLKIN